jgi:hypothetical protein
MNVNDLTAVFAKRFLGLKPTRDRFLRPNGSWLPKWRFSPFASVEDALLVVDHAASEFKLSRVQGGLFTAEVRIGGRTGKAAGADKARTISCAIADAIGLEITEP